MTSLALALALKSSVCWAFTGGYQSDGILKPYGDYGLAISSIDDTMTIRDQTTPANNYQGAPGPKFGSVRTSAAMCYLSNGLLGWGPENLVLQSQTFDNASWLKLRGSITANQDTAPDGTITADLFTEDVSNNDHLCYQQSLTIANATIHSVSIYAKAAGRTQFQMNLVGGFPFGVQVRFDLNAVTATITNPGTNSAASGTITAVGNGWYLCTMTSVASTLATAAATLYIMPCLAGAGSYQGTGIAALYYWGAQLERAPVASTYKPTTTTPFYGLRRDYDPRITPKPGYLIEEARTNLLLNSSNFTPGWNTAGGASITQGAGISPDGLTAAVRFFEIDISNSEKVLFHVGSIVATAIPYTASVYAKASTGRTWVYVRCDNGTATGAYFDLANGVVGTVDGGRTAKITAVGNGWYRCEVTATLIAANAYGAVQLALADNVKSYVGVVNNGILVWGAQLEAGGTASSYIPTTTAAVTRAVDLPIIAGTLFPLNQLEGSLYAKTMHMAVNPLSSSLLVLNDNTVSEFITLTRAVDKKTSFQIYDGGAPTALVTSTGLVENFVQAKVAGAYKLNDSAAALLGEATQVDTVCAMPTTSQLVFGDFRSSTPRSINGWIFEAAYFPRRLTNQELQKLVFGSINGAEGVLGNYQGLALSVYDETMAIVDGTTPANGYKGLAVPKLGSVRTSAAMQYNALGLLEWGPENLVLRSQEFDSASWTKTGASISANAVVAPDGTLTADKIVENSASSGHDAHQAITTVVGLQYTYSIYVKAAERTYVQLQFFDGTTNVFPIFNLTDGTKSVDNGIGSNWTATALSGGWWRFSLTVTCAATGGSIYVYAATALTNTYLGDGASGIYVWGAQLERSSIARPYLLTVASAVYGLRRDYDPRLSGVPGYLIEESRTNLRSWSETYTDISWQKTGSTIVANAEIAPNGLAVASKIKESVTSSVHQIYQQAGITAVTHTFSAYLKAAERKVAVLRIFRIADDWELAVFDLALGTNTQNSSGSASTMTGISRNIVSVGNGWYRCSITFTVTVVATTPTAIQTGNASTFIPATATGENSYLGDGISGIYVWGAQLEAGSFATSYIPTTTATVTRAVDLPTMLGTLFPLNVAEGALYSKIMPMASPAVAGYSMCLDDGTTNEIVFTYRLPTKAMGFDISDGGAVQASIISSALIEPLTLTKSAGAYKLNDSAIAQAGLPTVLDTACTMPTPTKILFGNRTDGTRPMNGWLFEAMYANVRLPNNELQRLASGANTEADLVLGGDQGLGFSVKDDSMVIIDGITPANNYRDKLSTKLGSVRTGPAMIYNSSGNLAWAPENLAVRSQEFESGSWIKGGSTVTPNTIAAPDGTLTADSLIESVGGTTHRINQSITPGDGFVTHSVYAKANTRSEIMLGILTTVGGIYVTSFYNLLTGQIRTSQDNLGASFANRSASIVSVGNGWYRCSITVRTINSVTILNLFDLSNGISNSYAGDGVSGLYIWGAQFEHGPIAKEYVPTTSAVIYGIRLDYDSRLSVKPAMLVEEARTNLLIQSEDCSTPPWSLSTRIAPSVLNSMIAPDGNMTADKIVEDLTANNNHILARAFTFTAAVYTYSVFLKAGGRDWTYLSINDGTNSYYGYFNTVTGAIGVTNAGATMQSVGDGWYRCSITSPIAMLAASGIVSVYLAEASGDVTYTGDGVSGVYAWGFQLEAGSFATSYIPTIIAAATRAADATALAITTFPYAVTGTLYAKGAPLYSGGGASAVILSLDNAGNDFIALYQGAGGGSGLLLVYDDNVDQATLARPNTLVTGKSYKGAAAYAANDFVLSVNGSAVIADVAGTVPTPTVLRFGTLSGSGAPMNGWIMEGMYASRRLSNAELQAKTV